MRFWTSRIDIARRHRLQPGGRANSARGSDRTNRHRRHQAADRDRCAASFRRRERRTRAGPEERRRESRRRHLPALGIDRSLARRRNQGDQCRGGALHRRRQGRTAQGGDTTPSTFLHFFLVPAADVDKSAETAPAVVRRAYRTDAPIPDLRPGGYDLNLTRVTFPAGMPSNAPHHRSGAALYYVLSGTGADTIDGKVICERPPLVHLRAVRSRAPVGQSRERAADLHHLQHQSGRRRGGAPGCAGKNAIAGFTSAEGKGEGLRAGIEKFDLRRCGPSPAFPCRTSW